MIWSVILYVIAGLSGLTFLILLLLLFTPFYLEAKYLWIDNGGNGKASFWWIHPSILTINYDLTENTISTKIAGWKIRKKEIQKKPSRDETNEVPSLEPIVEPVSKTVSEENETQTLAKEPEIQKPIPETMEKGAGKIDNLIERIKKNKITFFLSQKKWLGKIISWLVRFLKSFLHIVYCDCLTAQIKAGVEDPAVLGKIYGYYQAVYNGIDIKNSRYNLLFEPVFMKNYFEFDGKVKIRSSIGSLMAPLGIAIFTFPYLSTFLLWRRYKRRYRKLKDEKKS